MLIDFIKSNINILCFFPWLNLWSDSFFVQLSVVYLLYLIFFSKNIFYTVLYFFILMFYFGLFLAIYQLELFTGFLWLIECVVIFSILLLLFFLKTSGTFLKINTKIYNYTYICCLSFLIFICLGFREYNYVEFFLPIELNIIDVWDDYYESLYNLNINDFTGFLLSYYIFNSFELLMIGYLILLGSVICVNLNKFNKLTRIQNFDSFLKIFNFFKNFIDFSFIRQQNLINQNNQIIGVRNFKKKKNDL